MSFASVFCANARILIIGEGIQRRPECRSLDIDLGMMELEGGISMCWSLFKANLGFRNQSDHLSESELESA